MNRNLRSRILGLGVIAAVVLLMGCGGDDTAAPAPAGCANPTPVVVNGGQQTLWTATLTTTGNAVFPVLEVLFQQAGAVLSGSNRDNNEAVDVLTAGTVDGCSSVSLTCTVTNGGSPRAVIIFTGTISGTGTNQTISGTYVATGPSVSNSPENGTFTMIHQ